MLSVELADDVATIHKSGTKIYTLTKLKFISPLLVLVEFTAEVVEVGVGSVLEVGLQEKLM